MDGDGKTHTRRDDFLIRGQDLNLGDVGVIIVVSSLISRQAARKISSKNELIPNDLCGRSASLVCYLYTDIESQANVLEKLDRLKV